MESIAFLISQLTLNTVMQDIICFQRLSNGSIDPDSEVTRVIDLQETLEKQNLDITTARQKLQVRLAGIME